MNKIEEKFLNTFRIKPKELEYPDNFEYYPEITDEILVQLICIASTVYPITINFRETVDELKEFILDFCIRHSKELGIKQVQSLLESEGVE